MISTVWPGYNLFKKSARLWQGGKLIGSIKSSLFQTMDIYHGVPTQTYKTEWYSFSLAHTTQTFSLLLFRLRQQLLFHSSSHKASKIKSDMDTKIWKGAR